MFEQPDRDRAALAGLGVAVAIEQAAGADRFGDVAERWRALSAAAVGEQPDGPAARVRSRWAASRSRPTAAPRRTGRASRRRRWSSPRSRLRACARRAAQRAPDADRAGLARRHARGAARAPARAAGRAARAPAAAARPGAGRALPGGQRDAAGALRGGGRARRRADRRRSSWRRSCWRAKCRCTRRSAYDPAAVLGVLREEFPSCFVFCVGRGDATFVAASPELLCAARAIA